MKLSLIIPFEQINVNRYEIEYYEYKIQQQIQFNNINFKIYNYVDITTDYQFKEPYNISQLCIQYLRKY